MHIWQMNVKDDTCNDYLHADLAPSYGTLTKDSIKQMDDELKIMITATMKELAKIPVEKRSWEEVLGAMMQNSLIEPIPGDNNQVSRVDRVIKSGINVFKFDGSPNQAIVKEVRAPDVRAPDALSLPRRIGGGLVYQTHQRR